MDVSLFNSLFVVLWFLAEALPLAAVAYLLGCINGSILVSKFIFHDDIRTHGSGNAGLTNFYRTFGVKGVVGVLGCDILSLIHI